MWIMQIDIVHQSISRKFDGIQVFRVQVQKKYVNEKF